MITNHPGTLIVNLPSCADIYVDGKFRVSMKENGLCPLPLSDENIVSVYRAGGPEERVRILMEGRTPAFLTGDAIVLTDNEIVCFSGGEPIRKLSNSLLWADMISLLQDMVGMMLGNCGFFPFTESQKLRLQNFILALLSELRNPPQRLCVPAFAWFDYASKDETDEDDTSVSESVGIPYVNIQGVVEKAGKEFRSFLNGFDECHCFMRNSILLSFINDCSE